ncbi:sensor histidine kinase [Clostridium paraputrificum]|uniref:sensor histidine kinase n=1 Tax=Clostridium TaxID=1485 RepID=UPI003D348B66
MENTITLLIIIMTFFGSASTIVNGEGEIGIIINISVVIFICILQLLKDLTKINSTIIIISQLSIIIGAMILGLLGVEYLLPIVLFEIICDRESLLTSIVISIGILAVLNRNNLFNMVIYAVIINLYLYEVKNQYIDNAELKEFGRGQRYERFMMQKKIANLEKYLEQTNIMASLKERNFMAQKLHDHLGHRITSSLMQLEVTKEIAGIDNELSEKYLTSAMTNLREGMDEIRLVLRNVKPRDKVIGIEDIKEEILRFQYSSSIKVNFRVEGDTDKIKLNMWMIMEENIKEALTNAAKYSEATEISISILIYNKFMRIEIKDNGKGCEILDKGLGLNGMEERMLGIGGRIEYNNDNGFVINMILNLGE